MTVLWNLFMGSLSFFSLYVHMYIRVLCTSRCGTTGCCAQAGAAQMGAVHKQVWHNWVQCTSRCGTTGCFAQQVRHNWVLCTSKFGTTGGCAQAVAAPLGAVHKQVRHNWVLCTSRCGTTACVQCTSTGAATTSCCSIWLRLKLVAATTDCG